jgi:Tol biopolymer transport system component
VYIVDADGANLIEFTSGVHPAWSPDGAKIAFVYQEQQSTQSDLYVIGIDGTGRSRLTSTEVTETDPAWQPTFGTP